MNASVPPLKTRLRLVALIVLLSLAISFVLSAIEARSQTARASAEQVLGGIAAVCALVVTVHAVRQYGHRKPSDRGAQYLAASRLCFGAGLLLVSAPRFIRRFVSEPQPDWPWVVVAVVGATVMVMSLVLALAWRRHGLRS